MSILPTKFTIPGLPKNLEGEIIDKLEEICKANPELTIVQIIKKLPIEDLMQFLDCSMNDRKFLKTHEELMNKVWSSVDKKFTKKLNHHQQNLVLKIIFKHHEKLEESNYLPENLEIITSDSDHTFTSRLIASSKSDYIYAYIRSSGNTSFEFFQLNLSNFPKDSAQLIKDYIVGNIPYFENLFENLDEEAIHQLIEISEYFMLFELKESIGMHCKISPSNAPYYLQLAEDYNNKSMKSRALMEITSNISNYSVKELKNLVNHFSEVKLLCVNHFHLNKGDINNDINKFMLPIIYPNKIPKKDLEKFDKEKLILTLRNYPEKITHLNLSVYDNSAIEEIAKELTPYIKELDFSGAHLSADTINNIVTRSPNLSSLNLSHAKKIDPLESWERLKVLENLIFLDATNCDDIGDLLEQIVYKNAKHLEVLRIGFIDSKYHAGNTCLEVLASHGKKLKELDLSGLKISSHSIKALSSNEIISNGLKKLSLQYIWLDDQYGIFLIGSQFPFLESLNLGGQILDFDVIKRLLSSFGKGGKSKIEELVLYDNCRRKGDIDRPPAVYDLLAQYTPNLKKLSFTASGSTNLHKDEITNLVLGCPNLTVLDNVEVSAKGLRNLMQENIDLTHLNIYVKKSYDSALTDIAKRWPNIETLGLEGIETRAQGLPEAIALMPKLKKLEILPNSKDIDNIINAIAQYAPQLEEFGTVKGGYYKMSLESLIELSQLNNLKKLKLGLNLKNIEMFNNPNLFAQFSSLESLSLSFEQCFPQLLLINLLNGPPPRIKVMELNSRGGNRDNTYATEKNRKAFSFFFNKFFSKNQKKAPLKFLEKMNINFRITKSVFQEILARTSYLDEANERALLRAVIKESGDG